MTLPRLVHRACTLVFAVLLSGAGQAADRGLALTIGAPRGQPPLTGVVHDRANVHGLYTRLGFEGPLRERSESQLGLRRLRDELDGLARDTAPGDRVFLYFSGYGAAQRDAEGRCAPTWLAHDGRVLPPAALGRAVQALVHRAAQVVVVIDASAAAVPRGTRRAAGLKAAAAAGTCRAETAWLASSAGRGLLVLAAARSDEPAFDLPASGGVASTALLGCLAQPGFARNPLADFGDLRACASARTGVAGQRPVLVGNAELPVQPRLAALVAPSAEPARDDAIAALRRAAGRADAQWRVSTTPVAPPPGSGQPALAVTSDRDGFLYIVHAAAASGELSLVYPQRADEPNRLRAGQGFEVARPAAGTQDAAGDRWMVLVSERRLRAGDLLVGLGLDHYAAAACLRNLGSDDCPSTAAGAAEPAPALQFGATLLSADGQPVVGR